jgi:hypothetical protein
VVRCRALARDAGVPAAAANAGTIDRVYDFEIMALSV